MGYKTFQVGEEALAADVNSLLMSQTVSRFASASARTAAITVPVTNQVTLLDTEKGAPQYWDGAAWTQMGVTYERFFQATLGGTVTGVDAVVATFAMPITGFLAATGVAQFQPGTTANPTVALASFSGTSIPAPSAYPGEIGPLLAANAYRASIPFNGVWNAIAAGTAVTIKVSAQSSAGVGAELKIQQLSGFIRLAPKPL